jgi:cardiolipin synthase C
VLQGLKTRGVSIRILTNSLASHDVPAVNSHYKQWRKPLLESTDGLYEMRHDGANFDPRSASVNTEAGVVISSPGLANELAKVVERGMAPANSWRVELDKDGTIVWVNDKEKVSSQPARNSWQRVEDVIFMMFPKDLY